MLNLTLIQLMACKICPKSNLIRMLQANIFFRKRMAYSGKSRATTFDIYHSIENLYQYKKKKNPLFCCTKTTMKATLTTTCVLQLLTFFLLIKKTTQKCELWHTCQFQGHKMACSGLTRCKFKPNL